MTKYVLSSGGFRSRGDEGRAFYSEILQGLSHNSKILVCVFADIYEKWEEKFHKFTTHMKARLPEGVTPIFILAYDTNFEAQVQNADIIYFYGGDVEVITFRLSQYNLPAIFDNKVVAGTSAGAAVFATHYWSSERRKAMPAIGVLPIKFMPHYGSTIQSEHDTRKPVNWEEGYRELQEAGDTTQKIYAMPEGEYTAIQT